MSQPPPDPNDQPFILRYTSELLTLVAVLFIFQTGLVPFDFGADTPGASRVFFTMSGAQLTIPDTVSNIFLYLPVGFLLYWTLRRTVSHSIAVVPFAIAGAGLLSGCVEWLQAYSPARVSSMIDLVANLFGATIGALVSSLVVRRAPRFTYGLIYDLIGRPRAMMLRGYCLALLIFAAVPFSISFDVSRIKQAVKSVNFVPFSTAGAEQALAKLAMDRTDVHALAHLRWQRLKRWSRWAAEAASFVALAWILQSFICFEYGFGRAGTIVLTFWIGSGLAVLVNLLHFVVVSRMCDITDLFFQIFGLAAGVALWRVYASDYEFNDSLKMTARWRPVARLACAGTAVFILYNGVIPFAFEQSSTSEAVVKSESFLPFFSYFVGRFDVVMDDIFEKVSSYAVLASLWMFAFPPRRIISVGRQIASVMLLGVLIATAIEIVQVYSPVRVTSLTDLILAGLGCTVGAVMQIQLVQFYLKVREVAEAESDEVSITPALLSPANAMMASLADPRDDAPHEPTPQRPKRRTLPQND